MADGYDDTPICMAYKFIPFQKNLLFYQTDVCTVLNSSAISCMSCVLSDDSGELYEDALLDPMTVYVWIGQCDTNLACCCYIDELNQGFYFISK